MIARKRRWDFSDLYFFLLLLILFFHPQQKLFFLCAIMPFFVISFFTDWQWRQWLNRSYSSQFKTFLLTGAFLYSFFYISYFSYKIYAKKNNLQQKELVEKINVFYKNTDPLISIFDPSCIVYTRKTDCKYILDNVNWRQEFKSYLKKHNFDLILASRFLNLFELIRYKQSSFQYININNHIYYKALIIDFPEKEKFLKIENFNQFVFLSNMKFGNSAGQLQRLKDNTVLLDKELLGLTSKQQNKIDSIANVKLRKEKNPSPS